MQLNEANINTRNMGEGMQVPVGGLNTEAMFTKPPDYLQVSDPHLSDEIFNVSIRKVS